MVRVFGIAKGWEEKGVEQPVRSTTGSAGYDFKAVEDITIVPIWRTIIHNMNIKPQKIHTGISVAMEKDDTLLVFNRSSNPIIRLLLLACGVGVIDSDYEGEISFDYWNFGWKPLQIYKGERIGQGIFLKFLKVDDDVKPKKTRIGGNGSTGIK